MSEQITPPSKDPANEGSLQGVLAAVLKKHLQGVDGQLPARVIAYDRATNIATVQPLVQMLTTKGESVSRAQLVAIPVVSLGGGQAAIHFKIMPGDIGWIEASDRDISIFKQGMQESSPNTVRLHSFSDGKFIPDQFAKYTLTDADSEATIQSLDGTHKIELFTDEVKLTATSASTLSLKNNLLTATLGAATAVMTNTSLTVTYGGVTFVISGTGVAITGGTVTHNATNIGDTHIHVGSPTAPPGPISNTGVPV
jgi:hypothetical protein